ncbi:MAG: ABC transporter permease [Firmicutes bacterium]|nr:ABC transporter permease [Bacillota bacterium]
MNKSAPLKISKGQSLWAITLTRLFKNKLAIVAFSVIILLILMAIFAPVITSFDPNRINLSNKFQKPDDIHRLGTDDFGRDVLTRLIYGTRASLLVGLASTGISVTIGVTLGALSGYYGGWIDNLVMRLVDIFMCFPFFLMAIVLASILGPSIYTVMIVSGILSWPSLARMVRAEVLALKKREFIEAARALGLNVSSIIISHILPNVFSVIIVYATLGIAGGILGEAGLSYLGLGVKQPQPSWGNMLSAAQNMSSLMFYPWLWIPPGIMIFLTTLSINIFGDALRDALDPKQKK